MEWVQAMNNIKNRAEEIVLNEIIYVQEDIKMVNFREVNNDILKEWLFASGLSLTMKFMERVGSDYL